MVEKAIIFASEAHKGMLRKGTDIPYIVHPMEAGAIAASITSDKEIISAAILHDTLEDTSVTAEDIEREFGKEVLRLLFVEMKTPREIAAIMHCSEEYVRVQKNRAISKLRKMLEEGDNTYE